MTCIPAAGYELRLILSYGWLEFHQLEKSCGWFYLAADWSSDGWIQVAADSITRLFRVSVAGYKLWLTLSCGWLDSQRLDTIYSWFHPAAGYGLRLFCSVADSRSAGWIQLVTDLYFNIYSKFKGLFCTILHFYSLFSTGRFQLPLIQDLVAASKTLKKLKEASRSFKTLAATDSSCSGWFELRRLIRDLRPINYLQNVYPDPPCRS